MFVHKEPDIRTWKEELITQASPLFKRINKKSPVAGPHATKSGGISGNVLWTEKNYFDAYATEEQKKYYAHLKETNMPRADEYLLTITDSIDTWKQDIEIIEYIKKLLKMEENNFDAQLKKLKEDLVHEQLKRIPAALKKHIPEHIFDIDLNDIQSIAKLAEKEKALTNYLNKLREEMPFLFEDMR